MSMSLDQRSLPLHVLSLFTFKTMSFKVLKKYYPDFLCTIPLKLLQFQSFFLTWWK